MAPRTPAAKAAPKPAKKPSKPTPANKKPDPKQRSLFDEIAGDAAAGADVVVTDAQRNTIGLLAEQLKAAQERVEAIQAELKQANDEVARIQDGALPDAILDAKMLSFKMLDGSVVEVQRIHSPNVLADNKQAFYEWLKKNEYGDMVKSEISVAFAKGQEKAAKKALAALKKIGVEASLTQSVHGSTLKAWAKNVVEQGVEVPPALCTIYSFNRATIKGSKK